MQPGTFHALDYLDRFRKSGLTDEEATTLADALRDLFERQNERCSCELVSKAELREAELRFQNRLEANKHEILKWVVRAMLAQTGLVMGLMGVMAAFVFK